ncbi:DUF1989 domain-containing protein [Neptuniibacter pectenicola]|jgi:aminomethyltransferase|uniref:DUF1989 domain-containing protein n=1 Tax=Neptuniibacter pectenicola TaxID=1806669 RepID=UPI003AEB5DD5
MLVNQKNDLPDACYLNMQSRSGVGSFRVEPQQAIRLRLTRGDHVHLFSQDGEQQAELIVLDSRGHTANHLLVSQSQGELSGSLAKATQAQISESRSAGQALAAQLNGWGVSDQHLSQAIQVNPSRLASDVETAPATEVFEVVDDLSLVVIAAGLSMQIEGHQPVTELSVQVKYLDASQVHLPEPLATPKTELRIPRASAQVYEVKAGEWIQIIDVSGKQCSDFLAFDRDALSQGEELGLDGVATRTVSGLNNPQPGIYSRFLGADMQPMVEVVQDTVGRHDSFLMACNPKYYEDSGYFGHINCSDNFNRALEPYAIKPRVAWPAINFFFNTSVEPCGTVFMDEPWSRAGDYVLLRATRDLICASSACPDDIDPANGWHPTDIHVRIYAAEHHFPRSIAYRTSPQELPRMTKTTGFHRRVTALTKQMVEYRGYWVASAYEGWGAQAEYLACRERVAVIDLTPLRKFEVTGPDAEAFLQFALTRNVRRLAIGEIAYSAICHETGGMIDDGTIFRMGEQAFRWVCGDPYTGLWLKNQAEEHGYQVSVRNSTDQLHNIAVQGPKSRELLSQIVWAPECQPSMDTLAWFHFMIGRLGGPEGIPIMVSRTGYTGELGFEVWCHPDDAEAVWDQVWETGQPYNIAPLGFDALDMLRIEAGLIFADHEFCPETNPYEAGIGFTVPMKSKTDDFIGREAMARQTPESRQRLVGLVLKGGEPVAHGDLIYHGRFPVGVVTSASNSPLLGKQIALCRVAPDFAAPETLLEVGKLDGLQKRLPGEVVALPFYDPERTRVRS